MSVKATLHLNIGDHPLTFEVEENDRNAVENTASVLRSVGRIADALEHRYTLTLSDLSELRWHVDQVNEREMLAIVHTLTNFVRRYLEDREGSDIDAAVFEGSIREVEQALTQLKSALWDKAHD